VLNIIWNLLGDRKKHQKKSSSAVNIENPSIAKDSTLNYKDSDFYIGYYSEFLDRAILYCDMCADTSIFMHIMACDKDGESARKPDKPNHIKLECNIRDMNDNSDNYHWRSVQKAFDNSSYKIIFIDEKCTITYLDRVNAYTNSRTINAYDVMQFLNRYTTTSKTLSKYNVRIIGFSPVKCNTVLNYYNYSFSFSLGIDY
jgi:hypothetical protein